MSRNIQSDAGPLSVVRCRWPGVRPRTNDHTPRTISSAFTIVEMLIAMAITLVMIGAVVTLFANISTSVRSRRATIEMSGQLRHVRNMLQQDLQGATCPGLPWQRPEDNLGYIEIIEGQYRETNPSVLTDLLTDTDGNGEDDMLDPALSIVPRNNLVTDYNSNGKIDDSDRDEHLKKNASFIGSSGLGDYDDILMLTVRNEHEPFVGKVPENVRSDLNRANPFGEWDERALESPLAEVVWYAIENPDEATNDIANGYFGEPGMRTIYRRALLIAPWSNPYRYTAPDGTVDDDFQLDGANLRAKPGLLRVLPRSVDRTRADQALAALVAFQERYDLSVRLEFDALMDAPNGRWKIVANTLGDLTKRENRYEHYEYSSAGASGTSVRTFPFSLVSFGSGYSGGDCMFVVDPELTTPAGFLAARANGTLMNGSIVSYKVDRSNLGNAYSFRPFVYVDDNSVRPATARAMLNDQGQVVRVVHGPVPLSRDRRGEDVMLTDSLAFDVRVYDPGAPLFAELATESVIDPTDAGWTAAYISVDNMRSDGTGEIGLNNGSTNVKTPFVGQGAYVDLGYGFDGRNTTQPALRPPKFGASFRETAIRPWFFAPERELQLALSTSPTAPIANPGSLADVYRNQLARGYAVYDTWSFHYENNGLNEDNDYDANNNPMIDEGTNGLDERDPRGGGAVDRVDHVNDIAINGPDDIGERETIPPFDKPLRAVQVLLRIYETDSRQIRQATVNQSFVPE